MRLKDAHSTTVINHIFLTTTFKSSGMSHSLYREYLKEEEKFLKQFERNLQDQLNRLKVEELSLLKIISGSEDTASSSAQLEKSVSENRRDDVVEFDNQDEDDLPLSELKEKLHLPDYQKEDLVSRELLGVASTDANDEERAILSNDLEVNSIPLILGLGESGPATLDLSTATETQTFTRDTTNIVEEEEESEEMEES